MMNFYLKLFQNEGNSPAPPQPKKAKKSDSFCENAVFSFSLLLKILFILQNFHLIKRVDFMSVFDHFRFIRFNVISGLGIYVRDWLFHGIKKFIQNKRDIVCFNPKFR